MGTWDKVTVSETWASYLGYINSSMLQWGCSHENLWSRGHLPCMYMFFYHVIILSKSGSKPPPWPGCTRQNKAGIILLASSSALLWAVASSVGTCSSFPPFPVLSAFFKLCRLPLAHVWSLLAQPHQNHQTDSFDDPVQKILKTRHWYSWLLLLLLSPLSLYVKSGILVVPLLLFLFAWDLYKCKKQHVTSVLSAPKQREAPSKCCASISVCKFPWGVLRCFR